MGCVITSTSSNNTRNQACPLWVGTLILPLRQKGASVIVIDNPITSSVKLVSAALVRASTPKDQRTAQRAYKMACAASSLAQEGGLTHANHVAKRAANMALSVR